MNHSGSRRWFTGMLIAITALVLGTLPAAAASFQLGAGGLMGTPKGEFADNVENDGWGFTGWIAYGQPRSMITVGGDFGFMNYGRETYTDILNPLTPDILIDITTTNDIFMGHAFVRLGPTTGAWRPYVEGIGGFQYLRTKTVVEYAEDYWDEDLDPIGESTNWDDWTGSYGFGGGIDFYLGGTSEGIQPGEFFDFLLSFNARYLYGGEAEYMKEGSIHVDDDEVDYRLQFSKTDILVLTLGFSMSIGS